MSLSFLARKPDSGLGNIRSSPGSPSRNVDFALLVAQGLLAIAGCMTVYSASWQRISGDPFAFATRQVVFVIIASVVMFAVMSVDYDWFRERARGMYVATVAMLFLILVMGKISGQDTISFDFGPFNLQPAELAKFTTLIALCGYLAEKRSDDITYQRFLGGLMLVGLPAVLIIVQPDLGSASVIITIAMGVLLVAGAKFKYIIAISFLSLFTLIGAYIGGFVNRYQVERLRVFLDQNSTDPRLQDAVYQVRNALRAAGTGGLLGKGWLQGKMTNEGDVPIMWADFPFAAIGEQFGFVGSVFILSLYVIILIRIWRIASLSRDLFGTYLCAGVFTMLTWQVFQNVGMTLGIMPVTGLPLPLISYGGSSVIAYFALLGLVQSVHMRRMR